MLKFFHRLLENPKIYEVMQKLLGGGRVYKAIREFIEVQLKNISNNNVLDVGCGTGFLSDCFTGAYTGVDINETYIKKAETKRKRVFMVADATELPFAPETYDLVFTLGVLHHLESGNRKKLMNELWRVCKLGGKIIIVDGVIPSNRLNFLGFILAKLDRGRYKIRGKKFREMINDSYSFSKKITFTNIIRFPYEIIIAYVYK